MPVPTDAVDEVCNYITIDGTIPFCELPNELSASDTACCEVGGQEGCTPGFWKNHPDCWECFTPTTLVGSVFMVPSELSDLADDTLIEALRYKGGTGLSAPPVTS